MRRPHVIHPLKQQSTPRHMCFFDSEARVNMDIVGSDVKSLFAHRTIVREHDTYLVCSLFIDRHTEEPKTYYGTDFKYKFAVDIDRRLPRKQTMYLFAHNAKYDVIATGLVPNLCKLGWLVTSFCDNNPYILELKHDTTKRTLKIICSR